MPTKKWKFGTMEVIGCRGKKCRTACLWMAIIFPLLVIIPVGGVIGMTSQTLVSFDQARCAVKSWRNDIKFGVNYYRLLREQFPGLDGYKYL
jgi:hypothetical protein